MCPARIHLPHLAPGEAFPPVESAQPLNSAAPGLLASGGGLDVPSLREAYSNGIFPWFSQGQPILWWSPDPRMTLQVRNFKLHRSLRQTLVKFSRSPDCEICINSAFPQVIEACANSLRDGRPGSWILPEMLHAYCALNRAGFAHSVETWINGNLVGGLYCVAIGKAVFGESMFTSMPNASKIALAALVCFCRQHRIQLIDCQQNTRHLASLGATEVARTEFLKHVKKAILEPAPDWHFEPIYWKEALLSGR